MTCCQIILKSMFYNALYKPAAQCVKICILWQYVGPLHVNCQYDDDDGDNDDDNSNKHFNRNYRIHPQQLPTQCA